jgi:hypothetical protein
MCKYGDPAIIGALMNNMVKRQLLSGQKKRWEKRKREKRQMHNKIK